MCNAICAVLLAVGLAACAMPATTPTPYGNFIKNRSSILERTIADDAVKQLLTAFPPAGTRFELQQATPDAFGSSLVSVLRAKGYALEEHIPSAPARHANGEQPERADARRPAPSNLPLGYVLDQAEDSSLYRVTLLIGTRSFTRAYLAQNGVVRPASYWVRRE
jgi:hypothetical protein